LFEPSARRVQRNTQSLEPYRSTNIDAFREQSANGLVGLRGLEHRVGEVGAPDNLHLRFSLLPNPVKP
jgi:hypothetical protein